MANSPDGEPLENRVLDWMSRPEYRPAKAKAVARQMEIGQEDYPRFREAVRALLRAGRLVFGGNRSLRTPAPEPPRAGSRGVLARDAAGRFVVRAGPSGPVVRFRAADLGEARPGDTVIYRVIRRRSPATDDPAAMWGRVDAVVSRASSRMVGTLFLRDGQPRVRLDGTTLAHGLRVGDAGAKGARPGDLVVVEILRTPTPEDPHGEGVILEVLGPRGAAGVDLLAVIRNHGLPDTFPTDALAEAHHQAENFREETVTGRTDFTRDFVITIDPVDARDFDDAVFVTRDPKGNWSLWVHIADVGQFVPPGGPLDREARRRATSVYLPGKVLPMFPEAISNHLASLQEGRVRLVKTARVDFDSQGRVTRQSFFEGMIRVKRRLTYEQAQELVEAVNPPAGEEALWSLMALMRELAALLNRRRLGRGALELDMAEPVLEYDDDGKVSGAHWRRQKTSNKIIEEFMLAANEAVARHFDEHKVPFIRRIHPEPEPMRLRSFGRFVQRLGLPLSNPEDRFALQALLGRTSGTPEARAVHIAMLRSMRMAVYSADEDVHYALATSQYCHFTSPIRRYPDLVVHRQLARLMRQGRAPADAQELDVLARHCSDCERRAEAATRELVKRRILAYLADRIGEEYDAVVTGVAEYGIFAQGEQMPAEGRVHVSALGSDNFRLDEEAQALEGKQGGARFRLGDRIRVAVARVDQERLQLDWRLSGIQPSPPPALRAKYPVKVRRPRGKVDKQAPEETKRRGKK
jgi:ribonuclease R